jgi:hypothetical protein
MDRWKIKTFFAWFEAFFFLGGAVVGLFSFILVPWSLSLDLIHGGSAISGYEKAGAYFLVSHGQSTQVSRALFMKMLTIERATITCALLSGVAALGFLLERKLRP